MRACPTVLRAALSRFEVSSLTHPAAAPSPQLAAWEAHSKPVPRPLLACIHWLAAQPPVEGLFGRDGTSPAAVDRLAATFERDSCALLPSGSDPHDVAAVLCRFLRSLPEPLLTFSMYTPMAELGGGDVSRVGDLLPLLPPAREASLDLLLLLLSRVCSQAPVTKMDARALGEVFAPLLLWQRPPPVVAAPPVAVPEPEEEEGAADGGDGDGDGWEADDGLTEEGEEAKRGARSGSGRACCCAVVAEIGLFADPP